MERPIEEPAKKKIYEAPKLVGYGDLVEVTRALGTRGDRDHHSGLKTA
jgi:hypothetical protein